MNQLIELIGLSLVPFLLFSVIAWIPLLRGWKSQPVSRIEYLATYFPSGLVALTFWGFYQLASGQTDTHVPNLGSAGSVLSLLFLYISGSFIWKIHKAAGGRFADMGWPKWIAALASVPFIGGLMMFVALFHPRAPHLPVTDP